MANGELLHRLVDISQHREAKEEGERSVSGERSIRHAGKVGASVLIERPDTDSAADDDKSRECPEQED